MNGFKISALEIILEKVCPKVLRCVCNPILPQVSENTRMSVYRLALFLMMGLFLRFPSISSLLVFCIEIYLDKLLLENKLISTSYFNVSHKLCKPLKTKKKNISFCFPCDIINRSTAINRNKNVKISSFDEILVLS